MNSLDYVVDKVLKVIRRDIRKNTSDSYDTGTVKRIDGNIAWVQYDEKNPQVTPVVISGANCKKGDKVRIKNNNGTAFILGNDSNPPTDDAEALVAKAVAKVADQNATEAKTTADGAQATANAVSGIANTALSRAQEAKQIADDTEQHFWFTETGTDTGAHITEVTQEEWLDPSSPNYQSGGNLLARSNGIAVREGTKELATMSQDGFDAKTYDSDDNEVVIAHLGYGPGTNSGGGTSKAPYYDLGVRKSGTTKGNYSTAEGYNNTASGYASHAEGSDTYATGVLAHAEGWYTEATGGFGAHAEGEDTTASGKNAHAEGYNTTASGKYSHSQNYNTEAGYDYQTVIGKCNKNKSTNLFEIGNGTSSASSDRSNAFEVDKDGNVTASGGIDVTGKATLGAINGDQLFDYSSVSMTSSSISANASGEVTSSASNKTKYYPIAITNVNITTGAASLRRFYFSTQQTGKAVVKIGLQNDGTSAKTISVSADILWVKIAV